MSEFLQELQGFNQFLAQENVRRDQEWEKEKAKISAGRVAESFKTLTADHTERDARSLMYSVIADAAALDSLEENVGLIQALYGDAMKGIDNYKKEKQDKALLEYARSYGVDNENLSGGQAMDIARWEVQSRKGYDVFNTQGQHYHIIKDLKGKEIDRTTLDSRTQAQKDQEALDLYTRQQRIAAGFQRSTQPKFTPWNDPNTGEQLSYDPSSGIAYKPTMDAAGNVTLVPHVGGLSRPGTYSANNINNIRSEIKAASEVIKQEAMTGNATAGGLLSSLDLSVPAGDDQRKVAGNLEYVNSNQPIIIAKIEEDFKKHKDSARRDADYAKFQSAIQSYNSLQAAIGMHDSGTRKLSQDIVKKNHGVTPEDYNYIDEEVNNIIDNLPKYMTSLFTKGTRYNIYATDYEQKKANTARVVAEEIRTVYSGTDKQRLINTYAYKTMWDRLSPDERGGIMKRLIHGNENK